MAYLVPPSPISEEPKIWSQWGGGKGLAEAIGRRWTSAGTPVAGSYVRQFAYCGNGIVVGGSNSGHMARSTDYGFTWKDYGVPIVGCTNVYSIIYLGNGILLATAIDATGDCIIRSDDYGCTWAIGTRCENGWSSTVIGTFIYCGNGIVVIIDKLGYWFRTSDYGVTWTTTSDQVTPSSLPYGGCYCGNGIIVYVGTGYVWRSTDYGLTWVENTVVLPSVLSMGWYAAVYLGNGRIAVFAMGGYPTVSTDYGLTWKMAATTGVTGMNCYGACDCGGGNLVGCQRSTTGATDTVHLSHDWGESWYNPDIGVGTETILYNPCHLENGIVIVCASSGVVYRSIPAWTDPFTAGIQNLSRHTTATGATTLTTSHAVICVSTTTSRNITLPSAATCDGRRYVIKRIGATANAHVALVRSGGDTIDGAANTTITTTLGAREIIADGTNNRWLVINEVD
jgi:hypothetical protein